ncbi:MAG: histidine kinase [Phaeodactylibacter sp.]|nr:histidine kinase [Phaeodactylibacter sp.]MCB9051512.1 histidine kinase [Lewinellaceae bacterium]
MFIGSPVPQAINISELEYKLRHQKEPLQRLISLDKLIGHYIYTKVRRAQELLTEFSSILDEYDNPDFRLSYHWYSATIDNQLYNFSAAEEHFLKTIDILEERGTIKQQAEACIDYAGVCMNQENMDRATKYLEKAGKLLKSFPDDRLLARITCREGFMNLHYGNYSRAIELLLAADKSITMLGQPLELKDYYFLALIHSGLGKVYERNDDREKSVRSYLKVVNMCETMGMRTRLSWHYLNVGIGYIALNDQEKAEAYFRKAIDVTDDISEYARASAYANLGYCYYEKGLYKEALELFDRAEHLYKHKSEEDYYNFSIIEAWRGRLYQEQGEHERALAHYTHALNYAELIKDYKQLAGVCKDFANYYAGLEDFRNAFHYQCLHDQYLEKNVEQVDKRKQLELEVKYEAEKKKQETELLRLQATRLQLKALRAQMNPHFMYNALNSIQNYITSNEITSAAKYLAKFAQLMRQSLEYSDMEIISLEKEIEFLEDYLFINEKLRFEDRLKYEIIIDEEIEEDILGVPTMIVQPYVENAIEHGLRTKRDGLIRVLFFLYDEDTILCVVEDNGIGREKARQLRMQDPQYNNHRSRGTNITEKRLEILHNSKDKDTFVHTIDLVDEESGEARGTRVEIMIPIMEIQIK